MHGSLMGDLAIVLVVAAVTGLIARRLGQPSVLGYLLAGLIVGPYIPVPLFADPHRMEELAEVGVVLVLLAVGLEFRVGRLLEILPISGITALVQMSALGWAGYSTGVLMGWTTSASVTLAACLAISSTMVVSAVFRTQPVESDVRGQVFGVLVIQDVAAIVLIAVVTAIAAGQSLGPQALGELLLQLSALVAGMFVVGLLVLPRLVRWVVAELEAEAIVVLVAGAGFGFALAAESFGFSAALGAFIAGIAIAESGRSHEVERALEPLRAVFAALFFVSIGMAVDPVVAWSTLPLALLLSAVVIAGQFLSVSVASLLTGTSLRNSVRSGLALGQIGEFAFILATIAIAGDVVPGELLAALVTVATITAFTTPMLLGRADRFVSTLDRWLPDRANEHLAAYQDLVRRMRAPGDGPSIRKPATAVALDWFALLILVVVGLGLAPRLDVGVAQLVRVGTLVLAVPFLVGLVRSGLRLGRAVRAVVHNLAMPAPIAPALEALALLAALVAAAVPAVALLAPVVRSNWIELAAVVALGGVATVAARRMGDASTEYTSQVARLAQGLAQHADGGAEPATGLPIGLPELGYTPIAMPADAAAVGRTLAELNLRCRTGATVLAIHREGETAVLPTGHDRLLPGDTLAVSGSAEAIARAHEVLTRRAADVA